MISTYFTVLIGGAMIGLAAFGLLAAVGRIAGISGIADRALFGTGGHQAWRVAFLLGLVVTGAVAGRLQPEAFAYTPTRSLPVLVLAGLLVGFGTRLGNGCTSGHGVCGLARLSRRSLAGTASFMVAAMITVAILRWLTGGMS